MKLACEFIMNLCEESIVCCLIYLFAEQVELTDFVKASGLPAEQSIGRAVLTLRPTIQVVTVLVYV